MLVVAAILACSPGTDDEAHGGPQDATAEPAARDSFATDDSFVMPFTTRVPAGIEARVEAEASEERLAGAVRFAPGVADSSAFLRLVAFDDRVSRNDAIGLVRAIGTDFGIIGSQGMEVREATPPPAHPWSFFGYRLRGLVGGAPVDGWISLGERDGRYFYLMALYPEARAADLQRAFDFVLANWAWLPREAGRMPEPLMAGP